MKNIQIKIGDVELKFDTMQFSGGERHVQIHNLPAEIVRQDIYIKAHINSSNDLMDMILLYDAVQGNIQSYKQTILEIPYFPYARQDRRCAEGQAFSLDVIAEMIQHFMDVDELIVWDIHSEDGMRTLRENLPNTYITNIPSQDILMCDSNFCIDYLRGVNSVLVSPDRGALERTYAIQNWVCKHTPIIECYKKRDPLTGQILSTEVKDFKNLNLQGKTAVICDDIVDGGRTFIEIAKVLKNKLFVQKVILYATHGILSKGIVPFEGLVDVIYTTNSLNRCEYEMSRLSPQNELEEDNWKGPPVYFIDLDNIEKARFS